MGEGRPARAGAPAARREVRVEQLAEAAGVSVELVRSYQSKGLLPPPRHEGRVAYYGPHHLKRLHDIRALKERGYSLRMIASALAGENAAAEDALGDAGPEELDETFGMRELAARTGVPPAVLRSFEASGVLRPRQVDGRRVYTEGDVRAVTMLLALIGDGLPIEAFMSVAHHQIDVAEVIAKGAAELFFRYVREPLLAAGLPPEEEGERLVASFRLMLHATTGLMAYNFQRMILNTVQAQLDEVGSEAEQAALRREVGRRRLEVPT